MLDQFDRTIHVINDVILTTKNEILEVFEKQNDKNEIRFQKVEKYN